MSEMCFEDFDYDDMTCPECGERYNFNDGHICEDTEFEKHINMLGYFWRDYGNIEKYCYFENIKKELEEKRPDILNAWNNYKQAQKILNNLL